MPTELTPICLLKRGGLLLVVVNLASCSSGLNGRDSNSATAVIPSNHDRHIVQTDQFLIQALVVEIPEGMELPTQHEMNTSEMHRDIAEILARDNVRILGTGSTTMTSSGLLRVPLGDIVTYFSDVDLELPITNFGVHVRRAESSVLLNVRTELVEESPTVYVDITSESTVFLRPPITNRTADPKDRADFVVWVPKHEVNSLRTVSLTANAMGSAHRWLLPEIASDCTGPRSSRKVRGVRTLFWLFVARVSNESSPTPRGQRLIA